MGAKYTYPAGFRKRNHALIFKALQQRLSLRGNRVVTASSRYVTLLIALFFLSLTAAAQQPVQVVWPLTSDSEAVYSAGIASASFKAGPALRNFTYDSINGATASAWNSANLNPNAYYEYTIAPERDATITFSQLKFEVSLSSVNMRTALYYSKDGFNRQSVPMGNTVFVGKKSSRDLLVETNITVTYPEILSIRVYGWSAPNPAVSFYTGNVVFNGTFSGPEDLAGNQPGNDIIPEGDGERSVMISQTFTTSGSWVCPANVYSVTVECWGGGGRGGSVSGNSPQAGGGGGGGGYSKTVNIPVVPGTSYPYTVGAGSTTTLPGGDSYFPNTSPVVLARGGASVGNNTTAHGIGGAVGVGTPGFTFIGGNGADGLIGSYGGGGGSSAGTGANGNSTFNQTGATAPTGGGNGANGRSTGEGNGFNANITTNGPGGGGGGARKNNGNGNYTGGSGAGGQIKITYCVLPTVFNVTGGGAYCTGGSGSLVGLSGSQLTITYQLYINGTPTGTPVSGTGSAISFGNQLTAGTYTVVATNPDGMCTQNMNGSVIVSINPLPTATISGSTTVCQNTASPNITFTGSNGTAPYIFTYTINGGSNQVTPAGNPVNVAVPTTSTGTFTYALVSVQDANGCSQNQTGSATVIVTPGTPAQPGAITGNATPCPGLTNQQYTISLVPNATSYTWTVPTGWTITLGNGTNTINVTVGAFGQNGNITVTASNSCGTSTPSSLAVTVLPGTPAVPGPITGLVTQCPNATGQVYSITPVANATSYNWTLPAGWSITGGAGTNSITVTTGATGQNGNITVRAANSCGTSAARNLAVSVGPGIPAAPGAITGDITVCPAITGLVYSISSVPNATTYTWSVPAGWTITSGAGTTSITVTSGAAGNNGNITVTAGNTCGNSAASTLAVTVEPGVPATPGPISGTVTQCGNLNGQVYSITPVANASSYTWTVPAGWTITAGQGTSSITVTTGSPGQNGNITVTASNSCGTSSASILAVTVNPGAPATPGPITGTVNHCFQQAGQVYSIAPVANATTYTWTVPAGWTITAGSGTNSITVTTGVPGQNGIITVTAGNICGTSAASSLAVSVTSVPPQTGPITPAPATVCQAATLTFTVAPVPPAGTTYTWSVPGDWTITSGQGTEQITVLVGTQNGNITVTPSNNCGNGTPTTHAVTVTLLPASAGPITGDDNYCEGTSHTYSVTAVAGLTYNWTVPAGWVIVSGQGTSSIVITAGANSGPVQVNPVNSCGQGPASTFNVTINPLPAAFTGPDGGICAGGQTQIGGPAVPGNTYSWTSVPAGFTSNISDPVVTPFVTTTYYLTETTPAGCSKTNDILITTNEVIVLSVNPQTQVICPGSTFTITVSSNILGTQYQWDRDNTAVLTGTPASGVGSPITGILNSSNPTSPETTTFTIRGTAIGCGDIIEAKVTVLDDVPPVITCPGNQTRNMNAGTCTYTTAGTEFDPTVTDNCSVTLTNSYNGSSTLAGAVFNKGTTTVTWTATDPGGFVRQCSFTITVLDNIPPVVTCPGNQAVNVNNGCRYRHTGTSWDAIATDNCSITSLTYQLAGQTSGTGTSLNNVEFNLGTTTVTWRAGDGTNTVSCSFDVIVTDNVPPQITCPANVNANAGASCTAVLTLNHPVINDNCTVDKLTWAITGATTGNSPNTGINYIPNNYTFNVGTSTITYIITDQAGLTASCSFTVTVTDNTIPTIVCPATNPFYPNTNNQCHATLTFAATANDNCGIQGITYTVGGVPITFPYNFPIGTTTVTAVATDVNGLTSAPCSFNVLVRDTQLPVIACVPSPQSRTANTGGCTYTVSGTEFNPMSFSDNCPGSFITNNFNNAASLAGASFPIGNTTVVWTVQDASGNKSSCSVLITITDNEDPQLINCPVDFTVYTGLNRLTCDQTATWTPPTVSDNCSGAVTLTSNYLPGATFPVGNTTVVYTATDPSGNSTTCSFVITVIDNTVPTFTVPANITIYLSATCNFNSTVGVTGDVTTEFDNCTPVGLQAIFTDNQVPGPCPGTFIITRTWTLTDNHGNTTTKTQVITVSDNLKPSLTAPPEITVQCDQGILPAVTGQPTASDNCGNPVTVTYSDNTVAGTCPSASDITRTWTATDCSGNFVTKTQLIHVRDNTNPVITNVIDYSVDCPTDIPHIDPADVTATDNCGPVTILFDHEVAQFPPDVPGYCPRHIFRYFKVSDQCGNFVYAEQEIIIGSVCDCSSCNDEAPTFTIDFLGQPAGDTTIYNVRRDGLCCHAEEPNDCISFNVRIDAGSVGVQITIDGAVPGPHEWKVNCEDVEINDGIICLPGGTFYLFTYCKPGANKNDYRFQALADIVVAGEFQSRVSCNTQIQVSSNVTDVVWNSIFPGAPGQYNSYLSCLDCLNPFFNPGPGAPPVIKYQVCGNVANSPCVGTLGFGCDTITIYVHEPIGVTFNVDPGQFCLEAIPQIIATVTPSGTTYILEWFAGNDTTVAPLWTGNGFTPPGPGPYTLKVTDTEEGVPCSIYLYPFVVAPDDDPPVITLPPPLTLECNNPNNNQLIQDWLSQATATDEHALVLIHDYTGIAEACNTVVTVTWTATDDCNNVATASSTITVNDTQVPVWATALGSLDRTLECSDAAGLTAAQALSPLATDQCDPSLTITKTSGTFVAGTCPQSGTYTNTFIATDDCLNQSVAFTQVITIRDITIPVWTTTPGSLNASFDCSDLTGIAAAQNLVPVAVDNCDLSILPVKTAGVFVPSPTCAGAGTYTNTFIATDDCGNSTAPFVQVITITDNNPPVIDTPAQNTTVECSSSNVADLNAWIANHGGATASDVCSGVLTWTNTNPTFNPDCGVTGTYTVTFTVTDNCNNTASTTATFTITDTQNPTITCPADVVAQVDLNNCVATGVNLGTPVANDACSSVTVTNDAPAAFPPGVTIVTWTVTDECGNFATCTQTVTVEDLLPPSVICPADPAPVNADAGLCSAFVTVPSPNVTDPCPYTITNSYNGTANASDIYPVGSTTVTWTITGISGVSATCTQTVTVVDNQAPAITCPPDVLVTAPPPACSLQVINILPPDLNDNCDALNLALTWVKTGATTGSGTGDVNNTIFNVGITTVEYTVTDLSGNSATCTFTVTVNDQVPPVVINCPADITVNTDPGECFATVIIPLLDVVDPCNEIFTIVNDFNGTNNASGQYPVGTTTVTWTITDISGNITNCIHNVTVNDITGPALTCPPDAIDLITNGGCDMIPGTIQDPLYSDNCMIGIALTWEMFGATTGTSPATGINLVNGQTFNVGITRVLYTLTDASGNFDTCSFYVWIKNLNAPLFQADCPVTPVNAVAGAACDAFVNVPGPAITNPCNELFTVTNTSPYKTSDADASGTYPVGTTTFTWTITDASGNITNCTQSVIVTDNTVPSLTCPPDAIDEITNGGCDMVPGTIQDPLYTDNCLTGLNLTWEMFGATTGTSPATGINLVNGETFNVGITRVLYTLTDATGNFDTCSFYVWIKNLDAPQFHADCPVTPVNAVAGSNCDAAVTVPGPAITNPCNELFTVTNTSPYKTSDADASGTYPVGTTTFTWTITDASGNVTTCTQSVIVTDNTVPSLTCPPDAIDEITNGGCDMVPGTIQDPGYTDNCLTGLALTWEMFGATTGTSPATGINLVNGETFNVGITRVQYTLTDASGNFDTCSFYVWIKNLDAPEFQAACPVPSVSVNAGPACDTFVNVPAPVITNPCNELFTITNTSPFKTSDADASGTYPPGTTSFVWTITDASGNVTTCPQSVTVTDVTPPTLACPPDAIDQIINGGCDMIPATIGNPVFDDNCAVTILTWEMTGATTGNSPATGINLVNGQTFNVGQTFVTYTAYDAAGNSTTCTFMVWVKSLVAPEFQVTCPDPDITVDASVDCDTYVAVPAPGITNPCNELYTITNTSPFKTSDADASGIYPPGTTSFVWTITDASGNVTTCPQSVTVTDNTPPTLTCPPDAIDEITNGGCDMVPATIGLPAYDDNCGVVTLRWAMAGATVGVSPATGINLVNGQSFNVGQTFVTYVAFDAAGNSATCTFMVWVKNLDAPLFQAECPVAAVSVNAGPDCDTYVTVPGPVITNPCNELFTVTNTSPYKTSDADASGIYPVGTTSFLWTITDASGNITECPQSVTVTDATAPTLTCPPDAVDLIINGGCDMIPGTIGNPAYDDNCGVTALTYVLTGATTGNSPLTGFNLVNGLTFNVGITTVTYTAWDATGNSTSCSFIVWIKNLAAPLFSVTCPQPVVTADAGANCDAYVTVPAPGITNPCNEAYTSVNNSPYRTSDTDASGTYPTGTTSFTWTVTDASGNVTTCPQSVTVTDNMSPVLACPPDAIDEIINGGCDMVPGTIQFPTYSDNCDGGNPNTTLTLTWEMFGATTGTSPVTGINFVNGQSFNIGITRVQYTLTDPSGNTDTCSFYVWIKNLGDPQFEVICPASPITVSANTNNCEAYVTVPSPTIINPCDEDYKISNDSPYGIPADGIYPVGTTLITWEIIDASGTRINCFQNIIVVDDTPPLLTCPPSQVIDADFEKPYATGIVLGDPFYFDNCDIQSLTWVHSATTPGSSPLTGINIDTTSIFNVGVTTITYTATDIHGNVTTCNFTITVLSEPEITCPLDINTTTDPGVCSATLDPGGPTKISGAEPIDWVYTIRDEGGNILATGHCTTATIATCIGPFTFPVGTNTITWSATNISGVDECVQTIVVVDDEPPAVILPTPPSFCVNQLASAVYDGQPGYDADIVPESPFLEPPFIASWRRPDWYVLDGTNQLDIGVIDNCCATGNTISWIIEFAGNNPLQPDISGTGQPSTYGPIVLWGTPLNINVTHTITYTVTDCNGNQGPPVPMDILITPRPNMIKIY